MREEYGNLERAYERMRFGWQETFAGEWQKGRMYAVSYTHLVAIANYIIDYNATVRQAARKFGISKSTVHKDVAERLSHINPPLASRARVVLDINKAERHIRGGMATKEKYEHEHQLRACSRDEK